jgi:uncharacterized protein (DUF697 family)
MNKKKLPKAITQTADDMREAAAGASAGAWQQTSARRFAAHEFAGGGVAAPALAPDIAETAPKSPASSAHEHAPLALAPAAKVDVARRQSRARAIVERHANYSAAGGIIPLPLANIASITAIIVHMVKALSELYGVPYERDRARTIVIGLVGGTMPTGLSTVTASTLFYIVPGANLIGLAVSSVAASACTRSIGQIFVERFESGATLADFPALEWR